MPCLMQRELVSELYAGRDRIEEIGNNLLARLGGGWMCFDSHQLDCAWICTLKGTSILCLWAFGSTSVWSVNSEGDGKNKNKLTYNAEATFVQITTKANIFDNHRGGGGGILSHYQLHFRLSDASRLRVHQRQCQSSLNSNLHQWLNIV